MRLSKLLLATMCALTVLGTVKAQTVNYEIIENDPAFNTTMIMPFLSTYTSFASTFSLGGGIEVIDRHLPVYLRASVDIPLVDASLLLEGDKSRIYELGAEFPLIVNTKASTRNVVLKASEVSSTSTMVSSINVDGVKIEKTKLIRGGLMTYRGHYDENFYVEDRGTSYGVSGSFSSTGFYAGVSAMTRKDISIKTDEYGTTRNTSYFQFYADVLVGLNTDPGTWNVLGDPGYNVKDDLGMKTTPIGARMGLYYQFPGYDAYKTNGWGVKSELGIRPGPTSESKFLIATVFYTFNIK